LCQEVTAFTVTGDYIYISRELLQRLQSDDALAMIIAHEIGHIDLDHLPRLARKPIWSQLPIIGLVEAYFRNQHNRYEKECDADDYALDLCVTAGYDGNKALDFFDVLLAYARMKRASDVAYGTWLRLDEDLEGKQDPETRKRQRLEDKTFKYPSIVKRKERLLSRLN